MGSFSYTYLLPEMEFTVRNVQDKKLKKIQAQYFLQFLLSYAHNFLVLKTEAFHNIFDCGISLNFFSESVIRFPNIQISKKKIFQKTILDMKFKIPAYNSIVLWAGILNFKCRIVFWNLFFWRFGITLSEEKPPLTGMSHENT